MLCKAMVINSRSRKIRKIWPNVKLNAPDYAINGAIKNLKFYNLEDLLLDLRGQKASSCVISNFKKLGYLLTDTSDKIKCYQTL